MDLLIAFFKRLMCKHKYEFRAKYIRNINNNLRYFNDYQCSLCGKRITKNTNKYEDLI